VTVAVAAFDFDGTLTTRDTVWPFLRCAAGAPAIWRGLPLAAPALVGRVGGLLGSTTTKELLYRIYLRGRHVDDVVEAGRRFAREQVPPLIRPHALARLRWHQERGDRCLVVTASPELYVEPWANALGVETIGSRLQVDRFGHLTGRHFGLACDGAEKARRLRAVLGVDVYDVYAYGDSRGDRELLAMAQHPYYRVMPAPGLA